MSEQEVRDKESESWCCRLLVGGSLFVIFFLWNWPWPLMWCCSPLLKQVSQTEDLPLMKTKLMVSQKDSEISIHNTQNRGKRRMEKKNYFIWPVILLPLKDMLMKLCSVSGSCQFQYFSGPKLSFMVFVTFIWWEQYPACVLISFLCLISRLQTRLKLPQWF